MIINTKIFQTKDSRVAFMPWSFLSDTVKKDFSLVKYDKVFDGNVNTEENEIQPDCTHSILDYLFCAFNVGGHRKDAGYTGHSLSVSDVVYINENYYYCDSIGWKQLDSFQGVVA